MMYLPKEASSAFHFSLLFSVFTREMPSFHFSHKTLSVHIRLQKTRITVKFHESIDLLNTQISKPS